MIVIHILAISFAWLASLTIAPPAQKPKLDDLDILQLASVFEILGCTFYNEGLEKFDEATFLKAGYSPSIRKGIELIYRDEMAHARQLQRGLKLLGASGLQACKYEFPYEDVKSFVALAGILENVNISWYLGVVQYINMNIILTNALSALSVEGRHSTFFREANKLSPLPAPFDTPISPKQLETLVRPLIKECPEGSGVKIQGFPRLFTNYTGALAIGSEITMRADVEIPSGKVFCGFLSELQMFFTEFLDWKCQVPNISVGLVYVFLTLEKKNSDETTIAGPSILPFEG